ncbi:MAG: tRNA pseudouridine(55) synthase TruB [Campylobacterales bacterium]|nr:tRNA pseudouridine(55) synthase TruB [Campylobacterales bacterium]
MDRLFVVNKPIFISSNGYMRHIKKKYNVKKVGFSGTLDPFATGTLIVATKRYTKLFNYLDKTPKRYQATLWLGATSSTLDIEQVETIQKIKPYTVDEIKNALTSLLGKINYTPPQYCAKKINGVAAYKNAREGKKSALKQITSKIFDIKLLCYNHPFIHFEATVSEGTYIRSLGEMITTHLKTTGCLSSLKRVQEGKFIYDNEKALDPLAFISLPQNNYTADETDVELGKKLSIDNFQIKENGDYLVKTTHFFAIIKIENAKVEYLLNRMPFFRNENV